MKDETDLNYQLIFLLSKHAAETGHLVTCIDLQYCHPFGAAPFYTEVRTQSLLLPGEERPLKDSN